MAIGKRIDPEVIASGIITGIQERTNDKKERTGWRLTLTQETGSQLQVNVTETGKSDYATHTLGQHEIPKVGDFFAALTQVTESREWGASLRYAGAPFATLDAIHARLQPAKAA